MGSFVQQLRNSVTQSPHIVSIVYIILINSMVIFLKFEAVFHFGFCIHFHFGFCIHIPVHPGNAMAIEHSLFTSMTRGNSHHSFRA